MEYLTYIGYLALFLYIFWGLYVLVMGLYRAYLHKQLKGLNKLLAIPYILIGLLVDVVANIFVASVVFMELPKEWLVTTRLQRYMTHNRGYKKRLATYICDHLLDVFDPTGNHC